MRRVILIGLLFVACRRSEPQPRVAPAPGSAGSAGGSALGSAAPKHGRGDDDEPLVYRTAQSGDHVDPKFAGSGKTSLVASEDHYASETGEAVLAAGGNAADAAVATAFVLAVTHPSAGNVAGGGFAVVHISAGKDAALDFREAAPAAATSDMYLDAQGNPTRGSLIGDKASGVPGSVAGLWALHQKYGKAKWADLVAPAIKFAKDGFTVDQHLHESLVRVGAMRAKQLATAPLWWPNGKPRETGEVVKNPELAAVLQRIADKGSDGFYKGETADAIAAEMKRGGGLITTADLAGYQAIWRDPLIFTYRGKTLVTMPPPSSGGVVLAMTAHMLEHVDLAKAGWHSYEHVHELVEVWRRAYAARNEILGDPAFIKNMPIAKLMSQDYADQLAKTIGANATPSSQVHGLFEGDHTTNMSIVDKTGMAVAMTTTLNTSFGNIVMVDGFLLNDEMDDFASKPGSPNVFGLVQGIANKIEPGKRMLSSMSPTIVLDGKGATFMVVGGQGGPHIITEVWQTLSNVIDFGMAPAAAVAAPRVHHQHLPDEVDIEADAITSDVADKMRAAGYKLVGGGYGAANAIVRTGDGWQGAVDPRGGGAAIGDPK
ncbi:MAG TPA: gamma-glutamyltransferase [Kofleriaceae bacterium]|nr:gamma-glutamyltransferase [Kofleriaceae bacterium]